jgi:glutamate formiminotransferase
MLIQCVPNFSEGRRADVIEAIVTAARSNPKARLADWSADPDHNRMVVTLVGEPAAVVDAVLAAAKVGIDSIDLSTHKGVHPRLGVIDVVPIVPLRDVTMDQCGQFARDLGRELNKRYGIPIYLYEYASEDRRPLPDVRKKAFVSLWPDYGSTSPHPTAGATVVGARNPLIAYNIVLDIPDPAAARTIARELRNGGVARFKGVRALGLRLPSRHMTQVSINITDPEAAPLGSVFAYVLNRARELGVNVLESELIGAMPGATAFRQLADSLRAPSLKPGQILLETWPDQP